MTQDDELLRALTAVVGARYVRTDASTLAVYNVDGLDRRQGTPAAVVVLPGSTAEVAAVTRLCDERRVPLTPRGAGTGYSGGAVPTHGGVVLSLERLDRILEIDVESRLAVVEPHVVTARLQAAVEARGLFYPPDPASLERSVIGGNVAECAGGPRAFKYGTTRRYVLGLEAVLPTGEVIRTGGRTIKNVVGYDLTQLLVGSEGTLAIVTQVVLRLLPAPSARATIRATFTTIADAVAALGAVVAARVLPAAVELIDRESLDALARWEGSDVSLAPPGTEAVLLLEVDGMPAAVEDEAVQVERACRDTGASSVRRARGGDERDRLWRERRNLSPALRALAPHKINHDVVVPSGAIPALFEAIAGIRAEARLPMPCFGHVGDGNIHVNLLVDPADADAMTRAERAEETLFRRVVDLGGSISGEHGIGFTKARYLSLELTPATIALMRRLKETFDPHGILNPGKIFLE